MTSPLLGPWHLISRATVRPGGMRRWGRRNAGPERPGRLRPAGRRPTTVWTCCNEALGAFGVGRRDGYGPVGQRPGYEPQQGNESRHRGNDEHDVPARVEDEVVDPVVREDVVIL